MRSADRTLVGLHPHNLGAVDAEAHVSTREHDSVLFGRVADDTFSLAFVIQVGRITIVAVDVLQVHDLVVVEQLLMHRLQL